LPSRRAASFLYDCSGIVGVVAGRLMRNRTGSALYRITSPGPPHVPVGTRRGVGDAAVFVPWTLYQRVRGPWDPSGPVPSMKAWVDQIAEVAGERHLWTGVFSSAIGSTHGPSGPAEDVPYRLLPSGRPHFMPVRPPLSPKGNAAGRQMTTCTTGTGARYPRGLHREFVTPSGRLSSDAPTAYALALSSTPSGRSATRPSRSRLTNWSALGLPDRDRVRRYRRSSATRCHRWADDVAYRLLMQRRVPILLYPVTWCDHGLGALGQLAERRHG